MCSGNIVYLHIFLFTYIELPYYMEVFYLCRHKYLVTINL